MNRHVQALDTQPPDTQPPDSDAPDALKPEAGPLEEELVALWGRLAAAEPTSVTEDRYGRDWPLVLDERRIRDAVRGDGAPADEAVVTIVLASYSDYAGSTCDVANVRTLQNVAGVRIDPDRWCGHVSASVTLGESWTGHPEGDLAWLRGLVEMAEALEQYPVLDEHTLAEVEAQVQEQAWQQWLFTGVSTDLRDIAPGETEEEVDARAEAIAGAEPAIRAAYYDYAGEHGQWLHHGPWSVSHSDHSDAVRHVAATVLGWPL